MKFSIIVPCYKVEKYIRECLDSVISQNYESWEAVCVDDGSPDGTGAILEEYAGRDSRIKVIHQPNGGLSAARNTALKVAEGEWIYYLDSDDLMGPGTLSAVAGVTANYPEVELVWGRMVRFCDGNPCPWQDNDDAISLSDASRLVQTKYFTRHFQCNFYKRARFGDIRFIGESWCEERPYFAKCMARVNSIAELNHVVLGFRDRDGSITHIKMTTSQCMGYLDATRDVLKTLTESGKELEPSLVRLLMTKWMEVSPRYLVDHLPRAERPCVWRYWFASLKEASSYHPLTSWRRFTLGICRALPVRPVAWLVCYAPDWLKRNVYHRVK